MKIVQRKKIVSITFLIPDLKCPDLTIERSVTHSWDDQEVGDVIEVECKRNHVLIGEARLTCQAVATWQLQHEWSSDPPTCKNLGKYRQSHNLSLLFSSRLSLKIYLLNNLDISQ